MFIAMARYDNLRKPERNQAVKDYANAHPDQSAAEIGMAFNISRQRVLQITGKRPVPTKDSPRDKETQGG
jgi:hypothetical protein